MILIHCFLTDPNHVSAVVKSLRSIDNPPFTYGHISAFPNTPKSGCNNKNNRRKKYEHLWRISPPKQRANYNGIWFNKFTQDQKRNNRTSLVTYIYLTWNEDKKNICNYQTCKMSWIVLPFLCSQWFRTSIVTG